VIVSRDDSLRRSLPRNYSRPSCEEPTPAVFQPAHWPGLVAKTVASSSLTTTNILTNHATRQGTVHALLLSTGDRAEHEMTVAPIAGFAFVGLLADLETSVSEPFQHLFAARVIVVSGDIALNDFTSYCRHA
jgi:hypothetical protein